MKYTATLNGKNYEVELERVDAYAPIPRFGEAQAAPTAPIAAPAPAVAPATAPVQAAAPAPVAAPAPAAAPAGAGSVNVEAPMPGKILKVNVTSGQAVKYGECVIVMEAMKMENEIVAPQDGTVASVNVKAGDMVDTGAVLATLN